MRWVHACVDTCHSTSVVLMVTYQLRLSVVSYPSFSASYGQSKECISNRIIFLSMTENKPQIEGTLRNFGYFLNGNRGLKRKSRTFERINVEVTVPGSST